MRKVVANTTPLIALADIGKLDLLHQMDNRLINRVLESAGEL